MRNIPAGDPHQLVNVIIEIPAGSRVKYEYDQKLGVIRADRFLYTAFTYPFNYGFIPGTLSLDHDPLDVMVLASESLAAGTLVECQILGMLATEDEEGEDAKLIAVPKAKVDPVYGAYKSLDDIPPAIKNKISHFYETYKSIEPGKWVKITGWRDKQAAVREVTAGISRVQE